MKIYLATWLEEVNQDISLTNKGAINRLLSYFFISQRNTPNQDFKIYADRKEENQNEKRKRNKD